MVVVLAIATGIGFIVGTVAGYFGGVIDEILMRFTDIIIAFPFLILAIAVNAALGRGPNPNDASGGLFLVAFLCPFGKRTGTGC